MSPTLEKSSSGKSNMSEDVFAAFLCDETTLKTVAKVAKENGWSPDRVHEGGVNNAVKTLAGSASPQYLIVDISESLDPHKDMGSLAEVCKPGTIVIAIGAVNDVKLYRDLLTAGVQDYIVKPLVPEVLRDAIKIAISASEEEVETETVASHHKAIGIIGVRGGVGASTIATNTAWLMSNKFEHKTALLDLDLQFGTGALAFDLEPGRGLTDALANPGRVDSLFIERATVKYEEHLSILSAEAPLSENTSLDPQAIHHLLSELRRNFENIIIDLPRGMATSNPFVLKELNELILVTDLSLVAARDTIRLISFVKKQTPKLKIAIVANKAETGEFNEVNPQDFARSIEEDLKWTIPLDRKTALQATKLGQCISQSSPRSKVAAELNSLASFYCDVTEVVEEKKGFFDMLKKGGKS